MEEALEALQSDETPQESGAEPAVEEKAAEAEEAGAKEEATAEEPAVEENVQAAAEEAVKDADADVADTSCESGADEEANKPEASEEEPAGKIFDKISEKIDDLEKAVGSLNNLMVDIAGSSESTARQLNMVNERLHKENLKLKEGMYESLTLPLLKDVIGFASDIGMDIKRCRKNDNDQAAQALESTLDDIHSLLEKHDVEAYRPNEGEKCEPLIHKVLKTVETNEKEKDRTIAQVQGFGYRYLKGDNPIILQPCKVYAYQCKENGGN